MLVLLAASIDDVSSVDAELARVVAAVLALAFLILATVAVKMASRLKNVSDTVGKQPVKDRSSIDVNDSEHGSRTISEMSALSVAQGEQIIAAVAFNAGLVKQQFADLHIVIDHNGELITALRDDVKAIKTDIASLKAGHTKHGERLGDLEKKLAAAEARLENATCLVPIPVTAPSPPGVTP